MLWLEHNLLWQGGLNAYRTLNSTVQGSYSLEKQILPALENNLENHMKVEQPMQELGTTRMTLSFLHIYYNRPEPKT